jgi:hypothetical protein
MPEEPTTGAEPPGLIAKLGAALPVALAAVATTFAGMSSSEMARAMFWRSAAAQDQAKATSQWTLAGFKRDRSVITQAAAAQLRAAAGGDRFTPPDPTHPAAAWLAGNGPPPVALPAPDNRIRAVSDGIRDHRPEPELLAAAGPIPFPVIDAAIRDAELTAEKTDREWEPVLVAADGVANGTPAAQAARFELEARRYGIEAKLNQGISQLYEVRVRRTTAESDRHKKRSENFFYAMLVAQVGATGSALALARQRQSALWTVAGLAGLVSVAFGVYVYLTL